MRPACTPSSLVSRRPAARQALPGRRSQATTRTDVAAALRGPILRGRRERLGSLAVRARIISTSLIVRVSSSQRAASGRYSPSAARRGSSLIVDRSEFRDALLEVMERKTHWAWPAFTEGLVPRALLHIHLEQEYATYVRDFPVRGARAYVACPIPEARRELIANVYEQETGGLFAGRPHPELFLEYPRGLGMDLERFASPILLPAARTFRELIDETTLRRGWGVAACVTTIFLEGTANERSELELDRPQSPARLEDHPLVRHYGLPLERLALTKAHRAVEGDHRKAAWRVALDGIPGGDRPRAVAALVEIERAWQAYRDDVAKACGIARDGSGVRLASAISGS